MPLYVFWRGPLNSQLWLDRLPLLDVFAAAMLLLGIVFYAKHWLAPRTRLLFGFFLVASVFVALGAAVQMSTLVPILYLVLTGGIGYLLHEWLRVFPLNPLARSIGFGLIGLAIAVSCFYNFRSYFIAWPHNSATTATFDNRR